MNLEENGILVYDLELEKDMWIDSSDFDSEQHSAYEPEALIEAGLNYRDLTEEMLINPEKFVREWISFPPTWQAEKNTFYKMCLREFAITIWDCYMDDALCDEIKSVILSREEAKKGV